MTSVVYDDRKSSFNVFVRLYYDDFLTDFQNLAGIRASDGSSDLKSDMERYLDDRIRIIADNDELKGKVKTIKLDGNEVSITLVYKKVNKPGTIIIRNSIMAGLYNDMANMVILKIGEYEKGVKMTPENTIETFIVK
jgi:hypothetical protein